MIWVGRLICVAVILQSFEMLRMSGWPWAILRRETAKVFSPVLRSHAALVVLRLMGASVALIWSHPVVVGVIWFTTWFLARRWRGTFNGGSDFMTFHVLSAWWVSLCVPEWTRACAYYIVVQLILSYVVAGFAKLNQPEWRSGRALAEFFRRYDFALGGTLILSWILILFEISWPLAWYFPSFFIAVGLVFHLGNAYVFGLNRFLFAWLAAYPTLFLVTGVSGPQ